MASFLEYAGLRRNLFLANFVELRGLQKGPNFLEVQNCWIHGKISMYRIEGFSSYLKILVLHLKMHI